MVPEYTSVGGIGEAAGWLCLRMEIYVSMTTQTPIKVGLECFLDSLSIRRGDDYSWASKSILNLACLLDRAFREPRNQADLARSEGEIAEWNLLKPASYQPIFFQARSRQEGRCFPEIWTLAPHHAVGLQYFHMAQIILNAVGPQDIVHPYDFVAAAKARERQIRHHLYIVIGLAISNERAENTWFTARHCLTVWGSYLHHRDDQVAVLDFLERWRQRSGWKTSVLVDQLHRRWNENMEDD